MDGATVGLAMEPFRARQARLTSAALEMVGPRGPAVGSETNFANALIAAKDSRNYIILGDPATAINVKVIQGGEAY